MAVHTTQYIMMDEKLAIAREWAVSRGTRIASFAVCLTGPRGRYIKGEYESLEEALNAANRIRQGQDGFGRGLTLYVLTPEGWGLELGQISAE
jgi:hypothetical protein